MTTSVRSTLERLALPAGADAGALPLDVPTRTAYVMAVVTPAERTAAASFTAVPRSLAGALGPTLSGLLFAAGWIVWRPVQLVCTRP